jgi:inorganic pyrophosphatase
VPRSARHNILSEIAPFGDDIGDDFRVVIETPKGSCNKYSYDPACDCLELEGGPKRARALVEAGIKKFRKRRK